MSTCQKAVRPLTRCLRPSQTQCQSARTIRSFSSTPRSNEEALEEVPLKSSLNPDTITSARDEKKLMKSGVSPIGSRRRRAAMRTSLNIPFEQLPFHCFQEARNVLQQDREEKLALIQTERLRISNLEATDAATINGGERQKANRLDSMRRHLEYLKIQTDINDPIIKKRFEDGEGDMNKPIYRFLADRKWREYDRKVNVQRIEQFGVVPDFLPTFDPTASVSLAFRTRNVPPGEYVDSRVSEVMPRLKVQVFDKEERFVSVVVIDGDVPDAEIDGFKTRCHYFAVNIPLSPTRTSIPLSHIKQDDQLVLPWLPPFAQKGSPYHRYSVFVLQQKEVMNAETVAKLKAKSKRDEFSLRTLVSWTKVDPIGATIFRSTWDEGTAGVMERAGQPGADILFKRKRVIAIKPKEAPRGWEAKHAKAKYKPFMLGRPLRLKGARR